MAACGGDAPKFPPTLLYDEGWPLRLVLDWFWTHPIPTHPLTCAANARWFSEALLPSAFLPRFQGDPLAESWTHADGVIGHFQIGGQSKTGLALLPNATQLVVLEAKLFSPLSAGVQSAKFYDQAARTVACLAEVLRLAQRRAEDMEQVGFYVLAPQTQIEQHIFTKQLSRESIANKVAQRVQAYAGAKDAWHLDWFQPTLSTIKLGLLSWEELIATVQAVDGESGTALDTFYRRALVFNGGLGAEPGQPLPA
ncbi:MAG TPA: hypothetical protein PKE45_03610 [Caldilineaceae bacterium]|nr:hypothetical protein [Caldilineaceae bacterium]